MTSASTATALQQRALQELILDDDLEHLEDLLAEFNIFDVLKIERRELQHSALLAWLLDPFGSHGLRDYFLRGFLSEAAATAHQKEISVATPLDVDGWKLNDVQVVTERHNIDILVISHDDEFVCAIENKIGTSEHSDQLNRYLRTVESEYEELIPFPIFLTPDGIDPASPADAELYVSLGYDTIANLIERTLQTRGVHNQRQRLGFLGSVRSHLAEICDDHHRQHRRLGPTDLPQASRRY